MTESTGFGFGMPQLSWAWEFYANYDWVNCGSFGFVIHFTLYGVTNLVVVVTNLVTESISFGCGGYLPLIFATRLDFRDFLGKTLFCSPGI